MVGIKTAIIHDSPNIFALLIGIDKYAHPEIHPLKGCVNDAYSIDKFLTTELHVPRAHIKCLLNERATRKQILSTFRRHFIENEKIKKKSLIVFFYAGHGSRTDAPTGWLASDGQIETICPHDERMKNHGIPDRTMNALFRELASIKGDNILAIFDSCHSGGIGRDTEDMRSIETLTPIPVDLDEHTWLKDAERDADRILPAGFHYPFMSSHVLLAACRQEQKATEALLTYEGRNFTAKQAIRGVFTSHLVTALYKRNSDTTYSSLLPGLLSDTKFEQVPSCEGTNKNRLLFTTTALVDPQQAFKIEIKSSEAFTVPAGWIHGVTENTEFTVHPADRIVRGGPGHGILVAKETRGNSCNLVYRDGRHFDIPTDARVLMSVAKSLNVYLDSGVSGSVSDAIKSRFNPVDLTKAHIAVSRNRNGGFRLKGVDKRVPNHANPTLGPFSSEGLIPTLDKIAHYNFHLHRENEHHPLHKYIMMKMVELKEVPGAGYFTPKDDGRNLLTNEENPVSDLGEDYLCGLTLESRHPRGFFPYLFVFKPLDYTISAWYNPPAEAAMSPPLIPGAESKPSSYAVVGHGPDGGEPITWVSRPKDGESVDSIYFKLFVSTDYIDMKVVEQVDDESRQILRRKMSELPVWDSWKFEMACKKGSTPAGQTT